VDKVMLIRRRQQGVYAAGFALGRWSLIAITGLLARAVAPGVRRRAFWYGS